MQVAEFAPGLHKGNEILIPFDEWYAGQSLLEVVLVFLAIRRAMQDAIDVIENIFFRYLTPLPPSPNRRGGGCDQVVFLVYIVENPIRDARRAIA